MTTVQIRETNASGDQLSARDRLQKAFRETNIPEQDLMTVLGMFTRGSCFVKYLVLDDLYRRIKDIPGSIVEFGCWYGQNLVIFENLRAIYEPFNKSRPIIGFDTFRGYTEASQNDASGEVISAGNFTTLQEWKEGLLELLQAHSECNVLGHSPTPFDLVEGDVAQTAPAYFGERPESVVALAYFDMGLYEPTKAALTAIKPHLIPGSVILLDEFSWSEAKGETIAFKEVFGQHGYKIEKSHLTPLRAIVTIL